MIFIYATEYFAYLKQKERTFMSIHKIRDKNLFKYMLLCNNLIKIRMIF